MLIRTSGALKPGLYLLTLGHTCRYAIGEGTLLVTDPGLSSHVELLADRLARLQIDLASVERIAATHLHVDRIGGIPKLRARNPRVRFIASAAQAARLKDQSFLKELYDADAALSGPVCVSLPFDVFARGIQPDEIVADSAVLECSAAISLRLFPFPGHTTESLAFVVEPYHYLIADEGLGYFKGRELAAPGGDADLQRTNESLQKLDRIEINGVCLPDTGVLTGELVRRHLHAVVQNTSDVVREAAAAREAGATPETICAAIRDSFYRTESRDPCVLRSLEMTFKAIVQQLGITL